VVESGGAKEEVVGEEKREGDDLLSKKIEICFFYI